MRSGRHGNHMAGTGQDGLRDDISRQGAAVQLRHVDITRHVRGCTGIIGIGCRSGIKRIGRA